jgi:RNA polymerase sigma-70 factor (ECF subfamily)
MLSGVLVQILFISQETPQAVRYLRRGRCTGVNAVAFNSPIERQKPNSFDCGRNDRCELLAWIERFAYGLAASPRLACADRYFLLVQSFPTLFAAMAERPEAEQERLLVEAAQRGDLTALRTLLERFAPALLSSVILPRVGVAAESEEVLRDTLSRASERLSAFRWTGAGFFPWLRQIAINLIIDRARARQRRTKLESSLAVHETTTQPMFHAGAEAEVIEKQERALALAQLREALSSLNERYKMAIELRLIEERSREDCAVALSVSVATFDVILHRALTALRKVYGLS